MKRILSGIVYFLLLLFFAGICPCLGSSNILFIMDSSGSMWAQVDDVPKTDTAKDVLKGLIGDLPEDTNVGLMAYGHRKKEDCKDVEVLSPIAPNHPEILSENIDKLKPKGKTPLTYSLEQSLPLFAALKGQNNSVVLVSDGIDTCDGDPSKAAGKLSEAGLDLKVHVVGFDVTEKERQQLESIADNGKGRYFNAENAKGLETALAEVKKEVERESQPAASKQTGDYFFDDFEGEELQTHWEVLNPDPDAYIVENGQLLIIGLESNNIESGKVKNLFRLKKPLPEGDYIITMKFSVSLQTDREVPFLALYEDKDNFVATSYQTNCCWGGNHKTYFSNYKCTKGKKNNFDNEIWIGKSYNTDQPPNPVYLKITKEGRNYIPAIKIKNAEKPEWTETSRFTILRQKGNLVLGIFQREKVNMETTMLVDWVKIEALTN